MRPGHTSPANLATNSASLPATPSSSSSSTPSQSQINLKRKLNADKARHRAVHGRLSNEFKVGMRTDVGQDIPVPLGPTLTEAFHKKMAQRRMDSAFEGANAFSDVDEHLQWTDTNIDTDANSDVQKRQLMKHDETKQILNYIDTDDEKALVALAKSQGGVSLDYVDQDGNTLLHRALTGMSTNCARALVKLGVDVDIRNKYGETALHWAAINKLPDIVRQIIDKSPSSVNIVSWQSYSTLHAAVRGGSNEVLEVLLSTPSIDMNPQTDHGVTPLHVAVSDNKPSMTQILLDRGASLDIVDRFGRSPAHFAAQKPDGRCLKILIDRGAVLSLQDKQGSTALHYAEKVHAINCVKMIVDADKQSIDLRDTSGRSALHVACDLNNAEALAIILKAGPAIDLADLWGTTPLHLATLRCSSKVSARAVQLLVESYADLTTQTNELKYTPLHIASKLGHTAALQYMLNRCTSSHTLSFPSSTGDLPLHLAVKANQLDCVTLLLTWHDTIDKKNDEGNTPLHSAALQTGPFPPETLKIVSLLCKSGADVRARNSKGFSPISLFVGHPHCTAAVFLKLLEFHPSAVDEINEQTGDTLLHLARSLDVVKILLTKSPAHLKRMNNSRLVPLQCAIERSDVAVASLLDKADASVSVDLAENFGESSFNILHLIASAPPSVLSTEPVSSCFDEILHTPLKLSLLLKGRTPARYTPCHIAALNNNCLFMQRLSWRLTLTSPEVAITKTLTDGGLSAVHLAASLGNEETLQYLLTKCIETASDLYQQDLGGNSLAHYCSTNTECLRILLTSEIEFQRQPNFNNEGRLSFLTIRNNKQETILHWIAAKSSREALLLVFQYLGSNVDQYINTVTLTGFTALSIAASTKNNAVAEALLEHNVDLNIPTNTGETALSLAIRVSNHPIALKILALHKKQNLYPQLSGEAAEQTSLLHLASERGYQDILKELLAMGADISFLDNQKQTALSLALIKKRIEAAHLLLDAGSFVNVIDLSSNTPLHYCSTLGDNHLLMRIIHKKPELLPNFEGKTPLHLLASSPGANWLSMSLLLQLATLDIIDMKDDTGQTALHLASAAGNHDIVAHLISFGANINAVTVVGDNALHYAARNLNALRCFDLLVASGANQFHLNNEGKSAAQLLESHKKGKKDGPRSMGASRDSGSASASGSSSSQSGNPLAGGSAMASGEHFTKGVAKIALRQAVNFDASNTGAASPPTPTAKRIEKLVTEKIINVTASAPIPSQLKRRRKSFTRAAGNNDRPGVGGGGSNLNQRKETILHRMVAKNDVEALAKTLKKDKGLIDVQDREGNTPLLLATKNNLGECVAALLEHGADPNAHNNNEDAPLFVAIENESPELVSFLLMNGADPNKQKTNGQTPLCVAVTKGSVKFTKQLIHCGANANAIQTKSGKTALHLAAQFGHGDVIRVLLDSGATLCPKANNGDNPLHLAASGCKINCVRTLVEHGKIDIDEIGFQDRTAIHHAAPNFDTQTLQYLLEKGANVNALDSFQQTPLHLVAKCGATEAAILLLRFGADIKLPDCNGDLPIHLAAANSDKPMIELLVDKGSSLNSLNLDNASPLLLSCKRAKLETVEYILSKGADVNQQNIQGETPLHVAVRNNADSVVRLLLMSGAKLDIADNNGQTPLFAALTSNNKEIFASLLGLGAAGLASGAAENQRETRMQSVAVTGADRHQRTYLHKAARLNIPDCVTKLLELGADPNSEDKLGETPLHISCATGSFDVTRVLLQGGADVRKRTHNGFTPLMIAIRSGSEINLIETLTQNLNYEDINLQAQDGNTALHFAVSSPNPNNLILVLLVDKGARVNIKNQDGNTPLHLACQSDRFNFVEFLLGQSADSSALNQSSQTPLHFAAQTGNVPVIKSLLTCNSPLDQVDAEGCTALHCAAAKGNQTAVQFLVDKKANLGIIDTNGYSALHHAILSQDTATVETLLKAKANPKVSAAPAFLHPIHLLASVMDSKKVNEIISLLVYFGADLNVLDKNGSHLMHIAAEKGSLAVVSNLQERKIPLTLINPTGAMALHIASHFGHSSIVQFILAKDEVSILHSDHARMNALHYCRDVSCARILITHRPELANECDDFGRLPLHIAAAEGTNELVGLLTSQNSPCNVLSKGPNGKTAVHYAVRFGKYDNIISLSEMRHSLDLPTPFQKLHPLHFAVLYKQLDCAELLLDLGCQIDSKDVYQRTPLHYACHLNNTSLVRLLLDYQADANAPDVYHETPLHYAIRKNSPKALELLMQYRGNITAVNSSGLSPLHLAILLDSSSSVDPNSLTASSSSSSSSSNSLPLPSGFGLENDGKTLSPEGSRLELIYLLLKNGFPVDFKTSLEVTPLAFAASCKNLNASRLLLACGAHPLLLNAEGRQAITYAAESGSLDCLKLILDASPASAQPLKAHDSDGWNIMHYVCRSGNLDCFKYLLDLCPDLILEENQHHELPIHIAFQCNSSGFNQAIINLLVQLQISRGELHKKDHFDMNLLHWASITTPSDHEASALVNELLSRGLHPSSSGNQKFTAMHLSCLSPSSHLLMQFEACSLTGEGRDPSVPLSPFASGECGVSLLHMAAKTGNVITIQHLVNQNASITTNPFDSLDQFGAPALHYAALFGNVECCKYLVFKGANTQLVDQNGNNVLHKAALSGCERVIKYFLSILKEIPGSVTFQSVNSNQETPMHFAFVRNNPMALKAIFEMNERRLLDLLTAVTIPGLLTPLHVAAAVGNTKSIKFLLEHPLIQSAEIKNMVINARDGMGRTPAFLASSHGHASCVKLLALHRADLSLKPEAGRFKSLTCSEVAALRGFSLFPKT